MKSISSAHNSYFKLWKSLQESKHSKKEGLCLVSGRKIVPEMLEQFPDLCEEIIFEEKTAEALYEELAPPQTLRSYSLTSELFKSLDEFGTRFPLLIMKYPPLEQNWTEESPTEGLEVLAGLGEPSNLGALIRNCEAFGASLVLLKECAFPFHPKVIRASSGSVFRVKITQGPSILDLKENLIALDKEGLNIKDFAWPQNARLLVGEEGRGIPEGLKSSTNIQIPMSGRVESLNAVAATSIALFHYRLRHPLK